LNNQGLKKVGLKVTTPRLRILHLLETNKLRHLTAEDIYQKLLSSGEEIGLATIYRVLTQFESTGLVKRHRFSDEQSVFELNQGPHHDHLICTQCMRVEEFVDEVIEARQQAVASKAGYTMIDHAFTIYGICKPCREI
jgi:Fur family ferric uptake transcriptional regulator